jgi:prevent-host-death family protein
MTMSDTVVNVADAKAHFSELVGRVRGQHERVVITVHGQPAAMMISPDDVESMEETIAILSDPEAVAALKESEEQIARGDTVSLDELTAQLRAAGRLK